MVKRVSELYPFRRNGADTPRSLCTNPESKLSYNFRGFKCTKHLAAWVGYCLGSDNDDDGSSSVGVCVVEEARDTQEEEP